MQADYAPAYNNIGNAYYRLGNNDKAKDYYQKAIQLQPNYADAYFNYGRLLAHDKQHEAAIEKLHKAIEHRPQHALALWQLGQIYLEKKDYKAAIDYLRQRLAITPRHASTHHDIGLALLTTKHFTAACQHLETAANLDSQLPNIHFDLATAFLESGNQERALSHYLRQIAAQPTVESYFNAGVLMSYQERHQDAIRYLQEAINIDLNNLPSHLNIAAVYLKIGKLNEAISHYQAALKIKPDDDEVKHILHALQQDETPQQAPSAYLQHLFDQYATYYDAHLIKHLKYKVPQLLLDMVMDEKELTESTHTILDLGCGTGLCGELFQPYAKKLIGIDISEKMVELAQQKQIYHDVVTERMENALEKFHDNDLILAADALPYMGDLRELFLKIKSALTPAGLFAFTIEKTHQADYVLQENIRYAHSKKYIELLSKECGFSIIRLDNAVLRQQHGKAVEGYLVLLKCMVYSTAPTDSITQ